jgi:hypothetical protein
MGDEAFHKKQNEFESAVQALATSDEVSSLVFELASAKQLLREILEGSQTPAERQRAAPICRDLWKTIASLSASHLERQIKSRELVPRVYLEKFAEALTELVSCTLQQAGIRDYELLIDEIVAALPNLPMDEPVKKRKANAS